MNESESIARHEAAHACCHLRFNHPIESVGVGPGSGHCKLPDTWDAEFDEEDVHLLARRELFFQNIMASMAGKCETHKGDTDDNWRASSDYKQAYKYAMKLSDGDEVEAELWLKLAEHKTDKLIQKLHPQISKLTLALLDSDGFARHGVIQFTGEQIKEVLSPHGHSITRSTLT